MHAKIIAVDVVQVVVIFKVEVVMVVDLIRVKVEKEILLADKINLSWSFFEPEDVELAKATEKTIKNKISKRILLTRSKAI